MAERDRTAQNTHEDPGESSSATTGAHQQQEDIELEERHQALEQQRARLLRQLEVRKLEDEIRMLSRNADGHAERDEGGPGADVQSVHSGTQSHVSGKRPNPD